MLSLVCDICAGLKDCSSCLGDSEIPLLVVVVAQHYRGTDVRRAWYFVVFIDDYFRKLWEYMIRSKDQVLNYFQKFHVVVQRETWLSLKAVRSDNVGEYTSPFEECCRKHEIKYKRIILKTPQ